MFSRSVSKSNLRSTFPKIGVSVFDSYLVVGIQIKSIAHENSITAAFS